MKKFYRKYIVPALAGSGLVAASTFLAAGQGSESKPRSAVGTQPAWQKLMPVGGSFSVMMPGTPKSDLKTTNTAFGVVTAHIFVYQNTQQWYGVIWTDYPPKIKLDPAKEIDADRDNFIHQSNGTLLAERSTILGGVPGREFTADAPNAFITSRIFVIGNRTFQVAVAVPKGQEHIPEIDRFLNSFQVLK